MGDRRIFALLGAILASLPLMAALAGDPVPARAVGCIELVQNGNFETNAAWTINVNGYPASYTGALAHSGTRSMRLGLDYALNRLTFSSVQQQIAIPATATAATLTFWAYPISEAPGTGDHQEAILLYPDGATAAILWRTIANSQTWTPLSFNLSAFAGQTLILYFNVYNDGSGGRATLFLDDVSLQVCDGTTPTPTAIIVTATPTPGPPTIVVTNTPTPIIVTATPTPGPPTIVVTNTPTPIVVTATPTRTPLPPLPPGTCTELLSDGGFESLGVGWTRGRTPDYAALVGSSLVHSGNVAVRLGNVDQPDRFSYSSVRQTVTLPYGVDVIRLSFWHNLRSEDVGTERDRQEVILLDPMTSVTVSVLWRVTRDDRVWQAEVLDLTPFQGRILVLYFNVRNDGDGRRTAMYLDDVSLLACKAATPPPLAFAPGDAITPAPIGLAETATPTVTPLFTAPVAAETAVTPSETNRWLDGIAESLPVLGAGALFLGVTAVLAAIIYWARHTG